MTLAELRLWLDCLPPRGRARAFARLEADGRQGARELVCRHRQARRAVAGELLRLRRMTGHEIAARRQGAVLVAGVDEAGRGPLAGPVVAAAVLLPPRYRLLGLDDSKRLTPQARESLFSALIRDCLSHGVGVAGVEEIDRVNIAQAAWAAMRRAVAGLIPRPDLLLVDGYPIPALSLAQQAIVGGDRLSLAIAAASVVAKVTRDRLMVELDAAHPGYGFARHKGYATAEHLRAIAERGPCPSHRRSFLGRFR